MPNNLPVNKGISSGAISSLPKEWTPHFFRRFITNWLENGDVRNSIAGTGIVITGDISNPATISLGSDIQTTLSQVIPPAHVAPTTQTTNYNQGANDYSLVFNNTGSTTLTLLDPTANKGRQLILKTIASQPVVSASSNVCPLTSATPGTAILAGTAGKWATLVSDGTNWVIMQGN